MRKESPGREREVVFSCSRFLSRSRGWAARQDTTPALKPATLSIREAESALLGTGRRGAGRPFCSTGGNARGIVGGGMAVRVARSCCKLDQKTRFVDRAIWVVLLLHGDL